MSEEKRGAGPEWLNLPNRITLLRLLIAVLLFVMLSLQINIGEKSSKPVILNLAAIIFVVCVATDWLDGYLARRYGLVTAFGRIADPFVDKVVVVGTCIYLVNLAPTLIQPWFAVALAAREFLVTALRSFIEGQGIEFGAQWAGKFKMVLQSVTLPAVMIYQANFHGIPADDAWASFAAPIHTVCWVLVAATLITTLVSAWEYVRLAGLALKQGDA